MRYKVPVDYFRTRLRVIEVFIVLLNSSQMRQVPDNQEVFAHSNSDQSIIFDILEYVPGMSDEKALEWEMIAFYTIESILNSIVCRHHFYDLVGDKNGCEIVQITKVDLNLPKYLKNQSEINLKSI